MTNTGGEARNTRLTQLSLENLYTLDPHDAEVMENDNSEQREQMKKYIDGVLDEFLTERQRQVFKMFHGEMLSTKEIAKILHISPKTVRNILRVSMYKIQQHKKIFLKCL